MNRVLKDLKEALEKYRAQLPYALAILLVLIIYACSKGNENVSRIYQSEKGLEFKDARVLGSQNDSIFDGKGKLFSKTVKDILSGQETLKELALKMDERISELEKAKNDPKTPLSPTATPEATPESGKKEPNKNQEGVKLGPASENLSTAKATIPNVENESQGSQMFHLTQRGQRERGSGIVSFPVKETSSQEKLGGIVIPPGSYVKAKLMTGVEAAEGRTLPVLLQLDYAYIIPNQKRLDLSGCFMIAKSQGDLSTERVQMQASKLSCVSNAGKMFERDINGFVADDKDNSFAVMGSVNSKQDRVATMAFLTSVVEGMGKAIQQGQTTQTMNPLGGNSSIVTGDKLAYMGAGGAANAAGLVTQWYMRQAQNLLPTINVGSGQDVWVVMQETVRLPTDYFKKNSKGGQSAGEFTYFSRASE